MSRKALHQRIRSTDFLCGLHKKLKNPKKELRIDNDREQLIILIKAKDDQISSLKTALAEKENEAKEYKCERQETSSSDNHLKSYLTTSVYYQKGSDGPKPWYDEDYVSGHHTNSNPAAG